MTKKTPLILFIAGLALFAAAFMFYQKSEEKKRETEALRELMQPPAGAADEYEPYEPEPEPAYDPTDITQTPPGITPFVFGSACAFNWGLQMRQYCEGGDAAILDTIEGIDQPEVMENLTQCLNEMIQRIDTYDDPNRRYIDSEVPLSEQSRKALACEMTGLYGASPVFDKGSIGYMIKEHVESGNISRLENR